MRFLAIPTPVMTLEPIDPETAVELYLTDRENELADSSLRGLSSQLSHFVRWCGEEEIENLNNLTGRQLHEYRLWRRQDGGLNKVTENKQMKSLRVFIRWLETIDAVEPGLSEKVRIPTLSAEENSKDEKLDEDQARAVLSYLGKFRYASLEHVSFSLLWHTMMRTGTLIALDLQDYHPDEAFLAVCHRPETGTPLKNKTRGERYIAISDQMCEILDDWIAYRRPSVTDEHGREALLTTRKGRMARSTLRDYIYSWTRPCEYGMECPHGRDPGTCEAGNHGSPAKCPSSLSPHAIRRGSITYGLNNDLPNQVVSDRANVSPGVLEKHYDRRTAREKMEQRRGYLDNI